MCLLGLNNSQLETSESSTVIVPGIVIAVIVLIVLAIIFAICVAKVSPITTSENLIEEATTRFV